MSIFWTNCAGSVVGVHRLLSSSSSNFDSSSATAINFLMACTCDNGARSLAGHWTLQCRKRQKTDTERKTKTKSTEEKEEEERFLNVFD